MAAKQRRMKIKAALFAAVAAALAAPAVQAQSDAPGTQQAPRSDKRPNIILILADDMGVETVNAYGGEYFTPSLDRMAREGLRFDNAHATPLCSPSRTRLMTGIENHRNYEAFAYLAPGQRTFGNMLKDAGYATGIVGKWQLSGNGFDGRKGISPEQAGFEESALWQLKALDAKGSRYWGPTRVINGKTRIDEEGFGPDRDQAFALDFIERHKDRRFFLYYPMALVHDPFVPTPASMASKGDKDRFAGMMTYMDAQVGALLARLKELGLDENTIVVFTADNGTNRKITSTRNGTDVRGGKGLPTLTGTHVPLIVRAPGRVAAGGVTSALFDFLDFVPTFAEFAGVKLKPGSSDGVSQATVITGKAPGVRDSIFMHYDPHWVARPARFVFDAAHKLYADGRFVALDPARGVETEIPAERMTGADRARRAAFEKILRETPDVPFSKERFPMCVNRPSRDPKLPAIEAGCAPSTGAMGEDS
ncbi:arylsulfatase A [Sphingomonas koreensis]|uniref:sulfatase-like hydrolase/transferase n=1 Tax=Sphingomonas koreensis TaxID=93064 RepID=UPI000A034D46|nr:sulfatase-like hydrolase/transferase [Sphingomonas koreensis]PJI87272.1 arylsulfatase A [Sphingomonas koreensis]RSU59525.1 arylsulfatase A [Sphingomonas koreensis]RSU68679.1 arylsulfatase A [Sphingomonas koreensis]